MERGRGRGSDQLGKFKYHHPDIFCSTSSGFWNTLKLIDKSKEGQFFVTHPHHVRHPEDGIFHCLFRSIWVNNLLLRRTKYLLFTKYWLWLWRRVKQMGSLPYWVWANIFLLTTPAPTTSSRWQLRHKRFSQSSYFNWEPQQFYCPTDLRH